MLELLFSSFEQLNGQWDDVRVLCKDRMAGFGVLTGCVDERWEMVLLAAKGWWLRSRKDEFQRSI